MTYKKDIRDTHAGVAVLWFAVGLVAAIMIQIMIEGRQDERLQRELKAIKEKRLYAPMYMAVHTQKRVAFLYDYLDIEFDPSVPVMLPDLREQDELFMLELKGCDHVTINDETKLLGDCK